MTLKLFLQGPGLKKVVVIEAEDSGRVRDLIGLARTAGVQVEDDVAIFLEDSDEPIRPDATLEEAGLRDKGSIHVARCRKVRVAVRYGRETKEESFAPSQRLRNVFKWALSKRGFDISAGDAQDLVLALQGQQQPLDLDDHVGTFATAPECSVQLDLVPSDRIQGWS